MKLYLAPNTIAVAVAIALEEADLDYDVQLVDFSKSEQQSEAYAAINSKGRVPALETQGTILTEAGAILEYVASRAPHLLPDDPLAAARAHSVMYYLASTMHVNHAHKMRSHRWADHEKSWADMAAKVTETMAGSAEFVEAECLAGPYVLGEVFSIADAYLYPVCRWLPGDGVEIAGYPKISSFLQAMENRTSVQTLREQGIVR